MGFYVKVQTIQVFADYTVSLFLIFKENYSWIILPSTSADASAYLSADMPEDRFIKLKILLKHSRMF